MADMTELVEYLMECLICGRRFWASLTELSLT